MDVIEVFIKAGDSVAKDDALVTLETDKATMGRAASTPPAWSRKSKSPWAAEAKAMSSPLIEVSEAQQLRRLPPRPPKLNPLPPRRRLLVAASHSGAADIECDVLVLAPALAAILLPFRAADLA